MKNKKRSNCPISHSLDIIGDKWSLIILRDMMFNGKNFYNEFLNSDEGISTNILANRLEMLVNYNIIKKQQDLHSKAKWYYSLTEKGIDFLPTVVELILWGLKHDRMKTPKIKYVLSILDNKDSFIEKSMIELKIANQK
ncbi:helix-turn-helix domain-containing protein [Aquimarina sp. MMG016]|uniref:winged helix-turn-helix transcriptional regulator n=1 Tax=Aquimarina sp. MMG016 TaxID=2822690 RepID=UPI001B39EFAA|nr:helix-turn-helix domain-containing protein [Aquimarina sp. MMG016]MBQ4819036.1 helix-turn-helix transcriptional regulator [Aquimarina sp. MMG016]